MQESYDEDAGYGSENESYEPHIERPIPVAAPADEPMELAHLSAKDAYGIDDKRLIFSVFDTPANLARRGVVKVGLSKENQEKLKTLVGLKNRHAPSKGEAVGNLDQLVVVGMKAVKYVNGQCQPVYCNVTKQVPRMLHNNESGSMLLECTGGVAVKEKQNVLSPQNLFMRDMLQIWEQCDPTVLPKEFQAIENMATGETQCLVYTKGAAANLLRNYPQQFDNFRFNKNDMVGFNMAVVPNKTAEKLYNYMNDTIQDISKSFMSAKDLSVTFVPESGSWDNVKSFIGNQSVLSSDKQIEYQNKIMHTPARISVHFDMDYLIVPNMHDEQQAKKISGLPFK